TGRKLTVITRKAYGGAYAVRSGKHSGAAANRASPGAEIAVTGPAGAVNIMHRQAIAEAKAPEARREALIADYRAQFASPFKAAELGFIDEVIEPRHVRRRLAQCLELLAEKRDEGPRRKHGNIPL